MYFLSFSEVHQSWMKQWNYMQRQQIHLKWQRIGKVLYMLDFHLLLLSQISNCLRLKLYFIILSACRGRKHTLGSTDQWMESISNSVLCSWRGFLISITIASASLDIASSTLKLSRVLKVFLKDSQLWSEGMNSQTLQ